MKNKSYTGLNDRLLPKGGFKATSDQFENFMGQIPGYNPQKPRMMPKPSDDDVVANYIKQMEAMRPGAQKWSSEQNRLNQYAQQARKMDFGMRSRGR